MPVFEGLLHDTDDKVRMEAPEIFRVLGKRNPELVRPYIELLQKISESGSTNTLSGCYQGDREIMQRLSIDDVIYYFLRYILGYIPSA